MHARKRVLLLGYGPAALSALDSLAARFELVGVVRKVPEAGEPEAGDEVCRRARELKVPVLPDLSAAGIERAIAEGSPDCIVVSSHNRLLGEKILRLCPCVNVHHSKLPRYRGRAAINWSIINGELETAITIHAISPGADAGRILYQETIPIGPHTTAADVLAASNDIQRKVLGDTVARFLEGYPGEEQDESAASYGCARISSDGEIDWSQPTMRVYALIRGLSPPWPGAYTYLDTRRVAVVRAEPASEARRYAGRVPGRVIARSGAEGFVDVLTGDGVLRLREIRIDGGPAVHAATVITSTTQTLGLRCADLLKRIEYLQMRLEDATRR